MNRILILLSISISFSNSIKQNYSDISLRIISEALSDSTAYERLAYLCDSFGPRLSGSKNLENSINWIIDEMKKDGFDRVEGQRVRVPTWIRGDESVHILKPFKKELSMLGLGGSVSTSKSGITADVLVVNNYDDLESNSDKVKLSSIGWLGLGINKIFTFFINAYNSFLFNLKFD